MQFHGSGIPLPMLEIAEESSEPEQKLAPARILLAAFPREGNFEIAATAVR